MELKSQKLKDRSLEKFIATELRSTTVANSKFPVPITHVKGPVKIAAMCSKVTLSFLFSHYGIIVSILIIWDKKFLIFLVDSYILPILDPHMIPITAEVLICF